MAGNSRLLLRWLGRLAAHIDRHYLQGLTREFLIILCVAPFPDKESAIDGFLVKDVPTW